MSRATTAGPAGFRDRYGPWALVAGASEGLGAQFATQIAARGVNLVLLARRARELALLGDAVAAEHGVEVRALALDLADPEAVGTAKRETCWSTTPPCRASGPSWTLHSRSTSRSSTSTVAGPWCSPMASAGPWPNAGAAASF
jgi:hypothetical protein